MKKSIVSPGFVKRTLAKLLKIDQQLGIVVNGNVASKAIAVGKYVNLINSTITGKPDGIYVATGAVSSGGTVTAADISGNALASGVTNDIADQIAPTAFQQITSQEFTGSIYVRKSGYTVTVIFEGFNKTSNGVTKDSIIPEGFRPSRQSRTVLTDGYATKLNLLAIKTDGKIDVTAQDTSLLYYGTMTYVVSD